MLCEHCKNNQADVHLTKIINNEKIQLNLCEECANEYQRQFAKGFETNFSTNQFLTSLFSETSESAREDPRINDEDCPVCGLSYSIFINQGKLGCGYCYEVFQDKLEPVIKRIHGSSTHSGKIPERAGSKVKVKQQIKNLKSTLQKLVAEEKFEEAAEIRDQIKELERKDKS